MRVVSSSSIGGDELLHHDDHTYDVTVIGGGPVGMFAAFYAALRNIDVQLVESLPELGGQVTALYPEKAIFDIAGFVNGTGEQLITNLKVQIAQHSDSIALHVGEEVTGLERGDDGVIHLTSNRRTFNSRTVLIASGSGAFTPRGLSIDYDRALDGNKVLFFVQHLASFAGLRVAIAGGGDAAVDWALSLEKVANNVTLIHRRNNFRALESSVQSLQQSQVKVLTPYRFEAVREIDDVLQIDLHHAKESQTRTVEADVLLVNYGFITDNHIFSQWGLKTSRGDIEVDANLQTSIPGVYACGDAVTYPGKVKLISSGFGEVPTAVNHIAQVLYPERKQPLHS